MNRQPVVVVLMREAGAGDHRPRLLERDSLHAIQDRVGHLRAAVREAFAFPVRRVFDELLLGQYAGLGPSEARERQQESNGTQNVTHDVLPLLAARLKPGPTT